MSSTLVHDARGRMCRRGLTRHQLALDVNVGVIFVLLADLNVVSHKMRVLLQNEPTLVSLLVDARTLDHPIKQTFQIVTVIQNLFP